MSARGKVGMSTMELLVKKSDVSEHTGSRMLSFGCFIRQYPVLFGSTQADDPDISVLVGPAALSK